MKGHAFTVLPRAHPIKLLVFHSGRKQKCSLSQWRSGRSHFLFRSPTERRIATADTQSQRRMKTRNIILKSYVTFKDQTLK